MSIFLQVQELTRLAESGVNTINSMEDPNARFAYLLLTILCLVFASSTIYLSRMKFKDSDKKDDLLKKKEEIIDQHRDELIKQAKLSQNEIIQHSKHTQEAITGLKEVIKDLSNNVADMNKRNEDKHDKLEMKMNELHIEALAMNELNRKNLEEIRSNVNKIKEEYLGKK